MLRLGRGIRVQFEKKGQHGVLLFPEGIVTLNDSAFSVLSKFPIKRCDLKKEISKEYNDTNVEGFDDFLKECIRSKWILEN